ncbi:unnamed protein product [Cylicocyclus nassatus]|uniref:Uncharacterized protein n=1 Tax=Cylicocyclus nassatus TaxID=53992 RepID=A0AA36HEU5_CYLNA|nr:unnamed protein product [Cylicocyclus nassatus]
MKLGMWPRLCRKLEHRSARQIQRRICIIFDPHYVGHPSPLSLDTVLQANEMALQGKSRCEIALSLGISMNRLHNAMYTYKKTLERRYINAEEAARDPSILSKKRLNRERYKMLFESVLKRASLSQAKLAELLQKSLGDVQAYLKDFRWTSLVPVFPPLNAEEIEKEWHVLIEELSRSFLSFLEVLGEEEAWQAAMNEVMPFVQFSLRDVIFYLKALRKCIDKKTRVIHPQYIDTTKLSEKLSARGLVDKETFDLNKCDIYKRVMVVLRSRNREVFRQLQFPLTSREKLRILEICYRRLSNSNGNELITALPRLKKPLLVECIIERMHEIDPSWQPPLLFQRWIRSWHHAELFTKRTNNDEIRNNVLDVHFLRNALFEDPAECLYGSSSTTRQHYSQGNKETLDPMLGTSHPQDPAEAGTSFDQDPSVLSLTTAENNPNSLEDITGTSWRKKRRNLASTSADEGAHLNVSLPSVQHENIDRQEFTHFDDYFKGFSRIESQPDEHDSAGVNSVPYDIFGESVDDTILAGNIETAADRVVAETPASPRESSPSTRQSPEPTMLLEGEDDSFRNLKITVPIPKATPPERSREPDIMMDGTAQGWMKFLQ